MALSLAPNLLFMSGAFNNLSTISVSIVCGRDLAFRGVSISSVGFFLIIL